MSTSQQPDPVPATFALPSPRTIAFAIALVRSKPPEISIGEYIRLLRQHVAKGCRERAVSTTHRYLDRSSYWRSEYERMQNALKAAEEESINLRLELDALKGKQNATGVTSVRKKRRKKDEDTVPYPCSPKRQKVETSPSRSTFSSSTLALDSLPETEFTSAGQIGTTLLRSVFHIHAISKAPHKTQLSSLAYHIIRATSTISRTIETELRDHVAQESPDREHLNSTLTVAGRAMMFIVTGYIKLSALSESGKLQNNAVYAIVKMFKELLDGINVLSEYELLHNEPAAAQGKRISHTKAKAKIKAPKAVLVKENAALSSYTTFLGKVIEILDPRLKASDPLFEGIAYCILNKLGRQLYCTVFGHTRAPNLEAEILCNNHIDGIEGSETFPPSPSMDSNLRQAKVEAPYLIHLLNRIMLAAPAHLGLGVNKKGGKAKTANTKNATKGVLAITAKECLQRTLINSIFGTEGMDEHDAFMDCLKMPVLGDSTIPMPKVKDGDTQEWFKEEVWRFLGWDILGRES